MRKFVIGQVFIIVAIVMLSPNISADDDCLNICYGNIIYGPDDVYFNNQAKEAEIKYQVELLNVNGTSVSSGSVVKNIDIYYKEKNRVKSFASHYKSVIASRYNCEESHWQHANNYFDVGCQYKTLLLTVRNPRELYITAKLMGDNHSVIHSYTTHLKEKSVTETSGSDYYSSGQCISDYDDRKRPFTEGIVSIKPVEGPGVVKVSRNTYKLYVNYNETSHEKYKYAIALQIETSKKKKFYGLVVTECSPCEKYEKVIWLDPHWSLLRHFHTKGIDRYDFAVSNDDKKIIFWNYSKKFINRKLVFHTIRSHVHPLRIDVIKDSQTQHCDRFRAGGYSHTPIPDESAGYLGDEPCDFTFFSYLWSKLQANNTVH